MTEQAYDPLDGSEKYRVLRELGRGGMGEVFLGEHIGLGTRVVIKLLHLELSGKSALVDRMRLEAQACARLSHPNVVRVTDFDRTPKGRPFFVMEYLPGRSLSEEVEARGGFLPVAEAIDVTRQALAGLAHAHAAGLVHRDMKLDNLFVVDPSTLGGRTLIKILDFGVAKVMQGASGDAPSPLMVPTGTGVVVGTPRFFAPEQARGQRLDHRADIYAMGLVLYSLVAGRGPFDDAKNITEMARAHVLTAPEPPSRFARQAIPPALDAAVLRAVAKRPEDRHQSAEELSNELGAIAQQLAGAPESPGTTSYQQPAAHPPTPAPTGAYPSPPASHTASPEPSPPWAPAVATPHDGGPAAPTARLPAPSRPSGTYEPTQAMGAPLAAPPAPLPRRYSFAFTAMVVVIAGLTGAVVALLALRLG